MKCRYCFSPVCHPQRSCSSPGLWKPPQLRHGRSQHAKPGNVHPGSDQQVEFSSHSSHAHPNAIEIRALVSRHAVVFCRAITNTVRSGRRTPSFVRRNTHLCSSVSATSLELFFSSPKKMTCTGDDTFWCSTRCLNGSSNLMEGRCLLSRGSSRGGNDDTHEQPFPIPPRRDC